MTAIQRWFFIGDVDYRYVPEEDADYVARHPETILYCKAADVEQLELLIKRYLEDLAESRRSRDRYRADLVIADEKVKSLEAELIELRVKNDSLLHQVGAFHDSKPSGA